MDDSKNKLFVLTSLISCSIPTAPRYESKPKPLLNLKGHFNFFLFHGLPLPTSDLCDSTACFQKTLHCHLFGTSGVNFLRSLLEKKTRWVFFGSIYDSFKDISKSLETEYHMTFFCYMISRSSWFHIEQIQAKHGEITSIFLFRMKLVGRAIMTTNLPSVRKDRGKLSCRKSSRGVACKWWLRDLKHASHVHGGAEDIFFWSWNQRKPSYKRYL